MAFCLIMGTEEFKSQLKGYEGIQAQCANCGNWRTQCITRWPFFTVCFIPLIPLSTHKYKELSCQICNFHQDLQYRPDIQPRGEGQPMHPYQNQNTGGGGGQQQQPPQGWNQGPPGQQQQQGGIGGQPVYK